MNIIAITIIGLILYNVICIVIGWIAHKRTSMDVTDFFLAGRLIGFLPMMGTMVLTFFSAFWFFGTTGFIYTHGLFFPVNNYIWSIGCGVAVWVLGSRFWMLGKKYGFVTPSDIIADYYDSEFLRYLVAILGIIFILPHFTVQVMGSGLSLEGIAGIPYTYGTLFLVVVVLAYVTMGGMRGVAWNDAFRGIFAFAIAIYVFFWALTYFGGPTHIFTTYAEMYPKNMTQPGGVAFYKESFWIAMWIYFGVGAMFMPFMWIRIMAARSIRVVRFAAIGTSIGCWVGTTCTIAFGAVGAIIMPGLTGPATQQAMVLVLGQFAPVLGVMFILAGLAASLTTADSVVLSCSTMATRDIYQRISPKSGERALVRFGRITVAVFVGIGYIFALSRPGFIIDIANLTYGSLTMLLWPTLGCLYWKRGTKIASIAGLLLGFTVLMLVYFKVIPFFGLHFGLSGIIVSGVVYFVVSAFTPPPAPEKIEKFHGLFEGVTKRLIKRIAQSA